MPEQPKRRRQRLYLTLAQSTIELLDALSDKERGVYRSHIVDAAIAEYAAHHQKPQGVPDAN
jgi:metal-responsive CopG/Arc/MetJ family transcriptional regulator